MISNEQRLEALKDADPAIIELYGSIETGRILSDVTKKYNLEEGGNHIDIIGDVILGFYPKSDLGKLLSKQLQIPETAAAQIAKDLEEFLAPIPAEPTLPKADGSVPERLHLRPEGGAEPFKSTAAPDTKTDVIARPLTKADLMNSLSPKRTMQSDISHLKGTGTEKDT